MKWRKSCNGLLRSYRHKLSRFNRVRGLRLMEIARPLSPLSFQSQILNMFFISLVLPIINTQDLIWKIGWKKILIDIDNSQIKKWMLNLFLKFMINQSCCLSFSYQSELIITPTGRGPLGREALGTCLMCL